MVLPILFIVFDSDVGCEDVLLFDCPRVVDVVPSVPEVTSPSELSGTDGSSGSVGSGRSDVPLLVGSDVGSCGPLIIGTHTATATMHSATVPAMIPV